MPVYASLGAGWCNVERMCTRANQAVGSTKWRWNIMYIVLGCQSPPLCLVSGDGGGIIILNQIEDTPSNVLYCDGYPSYEVPAPQYRQWPPTFTVTISHTAVIDNRASCFVGVCSGGGLSMAQVTKAALTSGSFTYSGGYLRIVDSTFEGNYASTFGGGLYLGGATPGLPSCSVLITNGSSIANNTALRAGSQIYNGCAGNFSVSASTITMNSSATEVCPAIAVM